MKKFVVKIFVFAFVVLLVTESFCLFMDPYNVFHPTTIVNNGIEPNKNYLKMRNVISHPDWFDGFLFGSSRVGSIHVENITEMTIYNMTYSEALPLENLNNLKTLIDNNIIPKKVFLGLDSLSYTLDPVEHLSKGIQAPYELSKDNPIAFYKLYLDPAVSFKSIGTLMSYRSEETKTEHENWVYNFYHYGWTTSYGGEGFDDTDAKAIIGNTYRLKDCLAEIQQFVNLCKENNIELIVFTNPMYYVTYEASLKLDYIYFLKELANITSFYNFSGYSYISTNSAYYNDPSHYSAEVGDIMIDIMCYDARYDFYTDLGFGFYTTKDNVNILINKLEDSRNVFLKENRWP